MHKYLLNKITFFPTLIIKKNYSKITPHVFNIKKSIYLNTYFKSLWLLFIKKNIFIQKIKYFTNNESLVIIFHLFFSNLKLKKLRKKKVKQNELSLTTNTLINTTFLNKFLQLNHFRKIITKYIPFRLKHHKNKLRTIFKIFKKQFGKLYVKYKVININIIYCLLLLLEGNPISNILVHYISYLFGLLNKKQHNRFFSIFKKIFNCIFTDKFIEHEYSHNTIKLRGIRLCITGRIGGKTRAEKRVITFGTVPLNKDLNTIDYAARPAFSKLGSFGIKLWICY